VETQELGRTTTVLDNHCGAVDSDLGTCGNATIGILDGNHDGAKA
jgi:hypothetical protein